MNVAARIGCSAPLASIDVKRNIGHRQDGLAHVAVAGVARPRPRSGSESAAVPVLSNDFPIGILAVEILLRERLVDDRNAGICVARRGSPCRR